MEKAERREHILTSAAALFGEQGYHATSIADIIRAAGIARGTFYLYFENKRAIFAELLDLLVLRIKKSIKRVTIEDGAPSVRDQLLDNITRVVELLTENRALLSILLEGAVGLDKGFADKLTHFYDQIVSTIEDSLQLGQQMSLVRECDTRVAALAVVGALKEVLHDVLRRDEKERNLPHLAAQILEIFVRGVIADGVSIV